MTTRILSALLAAYAIASLVICLADMRAYVYNREIVRNRHRSSHYNPAKKRGERYH